MAEHAPIPPKWRNRIIRYGMASVDQLTSNPRNWRIHPKNQQQALKAVISELGVIQSVVINERTGYIIDGHLRATLAMRDEELEIPAVWVDLSPEEEAMALATFDPIGAMAGIDQSALDALIAEVSTNNADLNRLLDELRSDPVVGEDAGKDFGDVSDEMAGAFMLKPDMFFPSDQPYGIPEIRSDMLFTFDEEPVLWSGDDFRHDIGPGPYIVNVATSMRALDFTQAALLFYTEDQKFESVWDHPDQWATRILNAGFAAVGTPNFSCYRDQPLAVHVWNVYRARWVGRYFQEAGIRIIPDIEWGDERDFEFIFHGVPRNAPLLSVQVQTGSTARKEDVIPIWRRAFDEIVNQLAPQRLLVYGSVSGLNLVRDMNLTVPMWTSATLMDSRRVKLANNAKAY